MHFAAYKKHLGFYPDPSGVEAFKDKLEGYTISKGTGFARFLNLSGRYARIVE